MSSLFFKFKLNSLRGILPTRSVLHAILGFRRQIAAGALTQTNTTLFATFIIFLHFSWICFIIRIGLYNRWMKTPLLLCFKWLLGPFCFCSKRYLIPFCRMQKGISYRLQNPKKSAKIKVYCMRCSISLWQFAKRAQKTFGAVAKGNLLPFWLLCMGNPRIACNADHVLSYRWKNISKNIKMEGRFNNFVTISGFYTQQGLSNHITFRPIKSGATVPLTQIYTVMLQFF